jgi:hypothetical protein
MAAYLVPERGPIQTLRSDIGLFDSQDPDATDELICRLLGADVFERVPRINAYKGEAAQMYVDEMALIRDRHPNDRATSIRDQALRAAGVAVPIDVGIYGPALILTGAERLD